MKNLNIQLLKKGAIIPTRATVGSVGFDLYACLDQSVPIAPGETVKISTGIAIALVQGFAAFIYARSGLGINYNIVPANCVGVIDSDYRGEIIVGLINLSKIEFIIHPSERVAQMVIARCELPELCVCDTLESTQRGAAGFGSTGTTV